MMDLDVLRSLAMALLIMEHRPLVALDDEVRQALGMRARRGRFRCDDLQLRLIQLVGSSDMLRTRAEKARRRMSGPALTWDRGSRGKCPSGPVEEPGGRRTRCAA